MKKTKKILAILCSLGMILSVCILGNVFSLTASAVSGPANSVSYIFRVGSANSVECKVSSNGSSYSYGYPDAIRSYWSNDTRPMIVQTINGVNKSFLSMTVFKIMQGYTSMSYTMSSYGDLLGAKASINHNSNKYSITLNSLSKSSIYTVVYPNGGSYEDNTPLNYATCFYPTAGSDFYFPVSDVMSRLGYRVGSCDYMGYTYVVVTNNDVADQAFYNRLAQTSHSIW